MFATTGAIRATKSIRGARRNGNGVVGQLASAREADSVSADYPGQRIRLRSELLEPVARQKTLCVALRNHQTLRLETPRYRLFEVQSPAVPVGCVAAVACHDLIRGNVSTKTTGRAVLESLSAKVALLNNLGWVHR